MSDTVADTITLDNYAIDGRTLREWHTWLTTDHTTGEDAGHLGCPCSRYGRTSADVAWFAIAHTFATGADDWEAAVDYAMGLAVNDSDDIRRGLIDYGAELPTCLLDTIGGIPETCSVDGCNDEPDWSAAECYDHVHENDDETDSETDMGDFDAYHAWARTTWGNG